MQRTTATVRVYTYSMLLSRVSARILQQVTERHVRREAWTMVRATVSIQVVWVCCRMVWHVLVTNWIYVDVRWLGSLLPHHLHGERSGQGEDVNLNRMSF